MSPSTRAPSWLTLVGVSLAVMGAGAPDKKPPAITHVRVESAPHGAPIAIRAKIEDASAVFAPTLMFRIRGTTEFDAIELKKKGAEYEAAIPAEQVTADLEYFIEAFDEQGNGPARVGSPEKPNVVRVYRPGADTPEPELVPKPLPLVPDEGDRGGVLGAWWFWTAIGVTVGGGAVLALALTSGGVDAVDIVVRAPNPVEAMH